MCLKNEHNGGIPGQSCVMAAVLHSPFSPSFWCLFLGHANIRCPPLIPSGHSAVCTATETIFTSLLDISNRNAHTERFPPVVRRQKKICCTNFSSLLHSKAAISFRMPALSLHYAAFCLYLCHVASVCQPYSPFLFSLSFPVHEEPRSATEDRFSH